jgi:alcohol dehydrogenase class IV
MSVFKVPSIIAVGERAMEEAMPCIAGCGRKALIVTGPHIAKMKMTEDLGKSLSGAGIRFELFSGITGEPDDRMIREGVDLYRRSGCDFCIGFGGGSPLDSAKAISAMSVLKDGIADYNGKIMEGGFPPVVAIPTTAGTGSEATRFFVVTDSGRNIKMLLKGDSLLPRAAVVNPVFTAASPRSVTVSTGLDALTHAAEAYTSKCASPMTDTLALSSVRRIMEFLPAVLKDGSDLKARGEMSIAALEAGICINNSSVTIVHGMSRPIGALFHVPHGLSNAMLLSECLSFALDGAPERFAELGKAAGASPCGDGVTGMARGFLEKVRELIRICGVPSLREAGINQDDYNRAIEKMSRDAVASGSPANTRREVSEKDCAEIYRNLYA